MMKGKIIKGISGFYYVHVAESGIYECKAKGVFRKEQKKPLVGDDVEIEVLDADNHIGNVVSIDSRRTQLTRPAVANIDQALVIFASKKPEPNLNLLDRFLLQMATRSIPVIICFNKVDLITDEEKNKLFEIYQNSGYRVLFLSAKTRPFREELMEILSGHTTSVAGPSGVGKSTIVNGLQSGTKMETGEISAKIDRGKHTTRHSELITIDEHTYIMDTPGFSSLDLPQIEKEDLQEFYPELVKYEPFCRFHGCSHISEPDCGVKEACEKGLISRVRYDTYCKLYEELRNRKKY